MKKTAIIGLVLLLGGCTNNVQDKIPETVEIAPSSIYSNQGEHHNLNVQVFYPQRIAAVNEGEIEKVVLVKGSQAEAVEVTVSDQAEIDKIAAYFKSVQLSDETYRIESGNWVDFEITLKGKKPLYFRFNQYGVCTGMCLKADKFDELETLVADIKGDKKEVAVTSLYDDFVQAISWADIEPIIPKTYSDYEDEEGLIRDSWVPVENPAAQILRLANYINEDFDDYTDITNVDLLTAGLIQQADKYNCFEEDEKVCRNSVNGDLLYFPDKKPGSYKVTPDVYEAVPYSNVEKAGKEIFSESYTLPELNEGLALYQSLQGYDNSPADKLFFYHLPYEYWFATTNGFYILDEHSEGDLSTFTILKLIESYAHIGDMPTPLLIGKNGYEYAYSYEDSRVELIKQLQDHLEKWEYVLKKENDGYRLVSGHCLNRSNPVIPQVDPAKDAYYFDEQGLLKVNLASQDAALFNEWVMNQKDSGNKYKANVNDGLLSIWISDYHNDAVVFDLATGKTLNSDEVIDKLNINVNKIVSAIKAIPEYQNYPIDYESRSIGEFNTSRFFINSQGKLAYDFNFIGIILFEWEEVR